MEMGKLIASTTLVAVGFFASLLHAAGPSDSLVGKEMSYASAQKQYKAAVSCSVDENDRLIANESSRRIVLITGTDYGGMMYVKGKPESAMKISVRIGLSIKEVIMDYYYKNNKLETAVYAKRYFLYDQDEQQMSPEETSGLLVLRYCYVDNQQNKAEHLASFGDVSFNREEEMSKQEVVDDAQFYLECSRSKDGVIDIENKIKGRK